MENGRSNSELTRHIEIGYYWVKDLSDKDLIEITYCPSTDMIADYFTTPLQSTLLKSLIENYGYHPHQIIKKKNEVIIIKRSK